MLLGIYKIYFLFILNISFQVELANSVIVETENGKIRGKIGENYISFLSVPFAEPPVGEYRFEPPLSIKKNWSDILDCTQMPNECLQWNHFILHGDRLLGNEDCLYLNIFMPKLNSTELFPVVIFIHGGAFQYGTGNVFRPDLLMQNPNVVVVTISYRLGPLGFLKSDKNNISANLGLKDQRLALQWIKRNIKNFRGNPEQIVLTGFSAGGASVHMHLLKEDIQNLITSAVSFSGTVFCPWVLVNDAEEKTELLASMLNCTSENTNSLKTCLKAQPAENIVRAIGKLQFAHYYPFRIFGPVIETNSIDDSFLNQEPENIIKHSNIANIPWLIAYTSEDGGYNAAELMKKSDKGEYIDEFWEKFDDLAPKALFYEEKLSQLEAKKYSELLKQKYKIYENDTNLEKYFKIQKIFTDELFAKGSLKAIKLHKDFTKSHISAYIYENPSPKGIGNLISERDDIDFGCTHGDDVFLMFNVPHRDSGVPFRDDEIEISNKFLSMLKEFAKTGLVNFGDVPLPENKKDKSIQILHITKNKPVIMEFDDIL
ncbi:esterase P-like [Condylostylus longicornis]|uniref:esterase P-like n=1 Tax=Condylostylus longicornis TaxID=2530218 RepID=UPI00244E269B|nr:esterase P-like [Condylostylus longicornis]